MKVKFHLKEKKETKYTIPSFSIQALKYGCARKWLARWLVDSSWVNSATNTELSMSKNLGLSINICSRGSSKVSTMTAAITSLTPIWELMMFWSSLLL